MTDKQDSTIKVEISLPETKLLINYYYQAEKQFANARHYDKAGIAKEKGDYLATQADTIFGYKYSEVGTR